MYVFKWVRWIEKAIAGFTRTWSMKRQGFEVYVSYPSVGVPSRLYFVTRRSNRHPVNSYWCPYCYEPLRAGPEAPGSLNMVCKHCQPNWNFGCLPGAYLDPVPEDRRRLSQEEVVAVLGPQIAFEQALLGLDE